MDLFIWPSRGRAKCWVHGRPYKAGRLVSWGSDEFVCVNTHLYSGPFEPPRSSLWAKVFRP